MTTTLVHHARLAWDGARVLVATVDGTAPEYLYQWLAEQLHGICGYEYRMALSDSRTRLMYDPRPEAPSIERGLWRARLQDLLDGRPDLALPVKRMVDDLHREVFPTA